MSIALASRIVQEHAAIAGVLPPSVVRLERRRQAIDRLANEGLPTTRDENWKYSNLRGVEQARFAPSALASAASAAALQLPAAHGSKSAPTLEAIAKTLPGTIASYARYVFVDGVFAPQLSHREASQRGVSFEALSTIPSAASGALPAADCRFALLNDAFATDGARIVAAAEADCPACIELLFVATSEAQIGASYPRIEIRAEPRSRLGIIERHISSASEANFVNSAVNVIVGEGASLDHYRIQQVGAKATWIDTLTADLSARSAFRLYSVSLGAQSARSTVHVHMSGEHARVGIHAVSVGTGHQTHDAFASVEHATAHARTEQTFRGIAADRSRVAFNGKVIVREGAKGSDSAQSLRGLLAGREAEIDVRPQLEIYTDDVRCSHGATVGKLDEMMLFYLLSRGIDRDTAERLLKWAFLEDVIARIEVPQLRRQIEQSMPGAAQLVLDEQLQGVNQPGESL